MSGEYVCNQCPPDDRFRVPADPIGVELMRGHIREQHGPPIFSAAPEGQEPRRG